LRYGITRIKNYLNKSIFFKKLSIYSAGALVAKCLSFITLLYIVKILTVNEFSQYVLFSIIVDLLTVFSGFGVASTMLRIESLEKRTILNNSIVISALSCCSVTCIFILLAPFLVKIPGGNYAFLNNYIPIIIIAFIAKNFLSIFRGFLISIEDPKTYIKLNIIRDFFFLCTLILSLEVIDLGIHVLYCVLLAQTISGVLASIVGTFLIFENISIGQVSFKHIKTIIAKSWSYLLKNIIGVFQMEASKIVLSIVASSSILGVYSFFSILVNKLSFIFGVFDKAFIPKIKKLFGLKDIEKNRHGHFLVKKVIRIYSYFGIFLLIFLAIAFLFVDKNKSFFYFLSEEYLQYLGLFYLIIVAWVLGNYRSFFDVWQYMDVKSVGKRLVFAHLFILVFLYYGGLIFYSYFDVYGLIYNQILLTILYLAFSVHNYRKFCIFRIE
jgi:O-antigen/teichoic acid export membrane protein